MFSEEIEDFKVEILQVKRINVNLKSENTLFKVKIRKLEDEIVKKNKQIDCLINPRQSNHFRKLISEHGATLLVKLQEENQCLSKRLIEQDMLIRRLQNDIKSTKAYLVDKTKTHSAKSFERITSRTLRQPHLKSDSQLTNLSSGGSSRRPLSEDRSLLSDLEHQDIDKLYVNLEKIRSSYIQTEKKKSVETNTISTITDDINKCATQYTDRGSPESDFDRIELQRETPHEEMQQLHSVFGEMIHEVKSLKSTLLHLKKEQTENSTAIQNKDKTVEKLAEEIELLKQSKSMNLKLINKKKYGHYNFNKNKSKTSISQVTKDRKSFKGLNGSSCSLADIYGGENYSNKRPKTRNSGKGKRSQYLADKFSSKLETGDFIGNKSKESINADSDHSSTIIEFAEELLDKSDSYIDLT